MRSTLKPLASLALGLIVAAGAFDRGASAAPMSLESLLQPGATLQVGNLLFSEFAVHHRSGEMPTVDEISVNAYTDVFNNSGLRFGGAFTDAPGGSGSDVMFSYLVTLLDPTGVIAGYHLAGDPKVFGIDGMIAVSMTAEGVAPTPGSPSNTLFISDRPGDTGSTTRADFISTTGAQQVRVTTDIFASSMGPSPGGVPVASVVDQTFTTIPGGSVLVPEPASYALLASGLILGLVLRARGRRRAFA